MGHWILSSVTWHSWERKRCQYDGLNLVDDLSLSPSQPLFVSVSLSCPWCALHSQSSDKHTKLKPTLDPKPHLLPGAVIVSCTPRETWGKTRLQCSFLQSVVLCLLQHKEQFPSSHWRSRRVGVRTWDPSSVQSSFRLLRLHGPRRPSAGNWTSLCCRYEQPENCVSLLPPGGNLLSGFELNPQLVDSSVFH